MNKINLNSNLSADEIIRLLDAMGDDYTLKIIEIIKNEIEENIISELNSEIIELKHELKKHEDCKPYIAFFNDCFECLNGYYPCPSVTNEHDKNIIFDAILRGENARGK
jgi:hypothetical protein